MLQDLETFFECTKCGDPACPKSETLTAKCMFETLPAPKRLMIIHEPAKVRFVWAQNDTRCNFVIAAIISIISIVCYIILNY